MSEEHDHFYGGQAVLEGVMMRAQDAYATAVRRLDGSVIVGRRALHTLSQRFAWARWPLVRGNVALIDSFTLGYESLMFSGNVALEDEAQHREPEHEPAAAEAQLHDAAVTEGRQAQSVGEYALWLSMLPALALGIGLFVLLPSWAVDWFLGAEQATVTGDFGAVFLRNLVEGVLRLIVIIGYIVAISFIPYIRRVFEYHGAEHAVINAYEQSGEVSVAAGLAHSPLHPRCGTAFLLVVIVVKMLLNCFLGWPVLWLRLLLRIAVLPPIAGIAYEVIYYAGRHRNSLLARALAAPGLLMQKLTTRPPAPDQVEVAIYALAEVAPDVSLPEGFPEPERVEIGPGGSIVREAATHPGSEAEAVASG